MEKKELFKRVGSMEQLANIRAVTYQEGRAEGLRAYQVKNGPMSFVALADKCLDIGEVSYGGVNLTFLSKPGLQGRNHYDTHGGEAQRSIMGGLFFTAGLENICAPCRIDGKDYPMHGRIRTTPAEHVSADAFWTEDGEYRLRLGGQMREAELFGENLVLRRTIETAYGTKSITVTDEIENQGFRPEPLMLLYHINFGYPLLDEGTEILAPTRSVTARDDATKGHEDRWNRMDPPSDNAQEFVFIHDLARRPDGWSMACVLNQKLSLGVKIEFDCKNLPYFMEWKSTASGDYVVGLEPANSSVYGRPYHEQQGNLHHLESLGREKNTLVFTVLQGEEELKRAREDVAGILR